MPSSHTTAATRRRLSGPETSRGETLRSLTYIEPPPSSTTSMGMLRLIARFRDGGRGARAGAARGKTGSSAGGSTGWQSRRGCGGADPAAHHKYRGRRRAAKATECPRGGPGPSLAPRRGGFQPGGRGRLKRLAGRRRIQVNRLEAAVAAQNMKKPNV